VIFFHGASEHVKEKKALECALCYAERDKWELGVEPSASDYIIFISAFTVEPITYGY
jgi:hypothetical protein